MIVNMSPGPWLYVASIMGCVCCITRDRDRLDARRDACVQAGGNDVATQQTAPTPLEEEVLEEEFIPGPPPGPPPFWAPPPPERSAGRGLAMVVPHFCDRR